MGINSSDTRTNLKNLHILGSSPVFCVHLIPASLERWQPVYIVTLWQYRAVLWAFKRPGHRKSSQCFRLATPGLLMNDIGNNVLPAPVHRMCLDCEFIMGEVLLNRPPCRNTQPIMNSQSKLGEVLPNGPPFAITRPQGHSNFGGWNIYIYFI